THERTRGALGSGRAALLSMPRSWVDASRRRAPAEVVASHFLLSPSIYAHYFTQVRTATMHAMLPLRSVRSLSHPREAGIPFATSWAVELGAGETPQMEGIGNVLDSQLGAGCRLHVWYGAPMGEDIASLL